MEAGAARPEEAPRGIGAGLCLRALLSPVGPILYNPEEGAKLPEPSFVYKFTSTISSEDLIGPMSVLRIADGKRFQVLEES